MGAHQIFNGIPLSPPPRIVGEIQTQLISVSGARSQLFGIFTFSIANKKHFYERIWLDITNLFHKKWLIWFDFIHRFLWKRTNQQCGYGALSLGPRISTLSVGHYIVSWAWWNRDFFIKTHIFGCEISHLAIWFDDFSQLNLRMLGVFELTDGADDRKFGNRRWWLRWMVWWS